eukprot:CAMPEP_0171960818 /NCGR_PEP_ID=MMETSP0993-20121228/158022_1 /TAXON_ID=483369 /ORGANISM="non described non described, Strain CCMP2098" /LENGTH=283 /DNA_ID=CAMNT_0012608701 /DNA_START=30 /DNA_END=878 /DNA_ORIENTATION=-
MAVRQFSFSRKRLLQNAVNKIEVYSTPCVVLHPPEGSCDALLVPGNETLVGTSLPYFPIGGPVPEPSPPGLGNAAWGGMEAGSGMLYHTQVVDGAVHEVGGHDLARVIRALPTIEERQAGRHPRRCDVGDTVLTPAAGGLKHCFRHVLHAVPPFRSSPHWVELLRNCYWRALDLAWVTHVDNSSAPIRTLAAPLLGAGARGAKASEAAVLATMAVSSWRGGGSATSSRQNSLDDKQIVVRFACIDSEVEDLLVQSLVGASEHCARGASETNSCAVGVIKEGEW